MPDDFFLFLLLFLLWGAWGACQIPTRLYESSSSYSPTHHPHQWVWTTPNCTLMVLFVLSFSSLLHTIYWNWKPLFKAQFLPFLRAIFVIFSPSFLFRPPRRIALLAPPLQKQTQTSQKKSKQQYEKKNGELYPRWFLATEGAGHTEEWIQISSLVEVVASSTNY
jgi:hypothetical protein